ncbi:type VI secretion protein IcmF/TssM N-terminal domain-containing protein [Roseospira visakhapatnamensis]|nr:type VI secretion protein IcmF/TssM N-terminal domain-containing protein [Roseospira visakhapatnamensis]
MRARGRLVSWLRRDLARAHQLLRRSTTTGGRGSPYRLPWILVMGPPAAGKTRAVARAGLAYPDEDLRGGRQDAAGRTLGACVWLGDRAVLVDTGGALATDPAEAEDPDAPDRQARAGARLWRALVQRVRDERPALPLNAVILAVPLPWLAASTRERREAAARLLRQRLETVYQVTGQRLPIHVWLTQADRLAGFHASFETLGGQERDQVWGFSLPLAGPGREETALVAVPAGLDGLVRRLNARLLERLHQDPGMRQGAAIWAFPVQVASLRGPLSHMMEALFRGGGWQESLLPRSVHLVSGGVGGAAVDRLGPLLARRFSLDAPSMEAGADPAVDRVHDPERGWFLARALGGVILGEAGLVAGSAGRRRTRVMRNRLAMLAGLLVMGLGVALWGKSLLGNHALLDRAEADATTLREQIHGLAISGVSDTDFAAILPPLDMLREMPLGPARGGGPSSWTLTLGLYQGHAVHEAAGTTYDRALLRLLGPRLLLALERQLAAPGDPADAGRRVAMTAYLMLGDRRAFDGEVVWRWLESLATRALPGASAEAEAKRRALLRHAAAFLALGPPPMVLTPALEDRARLILGPGGVR